MGVARVRDLLSQQRAQTLGCCSCGQALQAESVPFCLTKLLPPPPICDPLGRSSFSHKVRDTSKVEREEHRPNEPLIKCAVRFGSLARPPPQSSRGARNNSLSGGRRMEAKTGVTSGAGAARQKCAIE